MPGQIPSVCVATLALLQIDADTGIRIAAIGYVENARRRTVVLRSVFEFVVVIVPNAATQGQHFRDDVEVD